MYSEHHVVSDPGSTLPLIKRVGEVPLGFGRLRPEKPMTKPKPWPDANFGEERRLKVLIKNRKWPVIERDPSLRSG